MAEVDLTEYNGGALVGTVIVLLILSWISVGLRTYTRAVLMKCLEIDDWLMIVAQVCNFLDSDSAAVLRAPYAIFSHLT